MFKDNCFVQNFDILENKIGRLGIRVIGDMLLENVLFQEVNLSGCEIYGKDIKQFLKVLFGNFYLKSLDFSYNDLGDEGVIYLGCVFFKN